MGVFCVVFLLALVAIMEGRVSYMCPPKGELVAKCNGPTVDLTETTEDRRAQFYSPGFFSHANSYPPYKTCSYEFLVPAFKSLVIDIDHFDVARDTGQECHGDGLYFLVDGVFTSKHCGMAEAGRRLTLEARDCDWYLRPIFVSNGLVEAKGFNVFLHVDDPVPQPPIVPPSPSSFQCGLSQTPPPIVGGNEVAPNSIPWQVGILNSTLTTKRPFCGGTLISPSHVLTAAHCTQVWDASDIAVVVGEHNTTSLKDGTVHHVECKQEHPKFSRTYLDYDFSMLVLKKKVRSSSMAKPACLPSKLNQDYVGEALRVSGWGRLQSGGVLPDVLHAVEVPAISNDECTLYYSFTTNDSNIVTPSMMCAGEDEGGIDACQGDSGGPMTHKSKEGITSVVGVVSWGIGCAFPGRPGVYSRVTKALPWIAGFKIMDTDAALDICIDPEE